MSIGRSHLEHASLENADVKSSKSFNLSNYCNKRALCARFAGVLMDGSRNRAGRSLLSTFGTESPADE